MGTKHPQHSQKDITGTYLNLDFLESGVLFCRDLLLDTQVVEVQVTLISLRGLSSEVVSRVANTLTLGKATHSQNTTKPEGLLSRENTECLSPVRLLWKSREVEAKSEPTLSQTAQKETKSQV